VIRTRETYFDKISTKALKTQHTAKTVINQFEQYCNDKHGISVNKIKNDDVKIIAVTVDADDPPTVSCEL